MTRGHRCWGVVAWLNVALAAASTLLCVAPFTGAAWLFVLWVPLAWQGARKGRTAAAVGVAVLAACAAWLAPAGARTGPVGHNALRCGCPSVTDLGRHVPSVPCPRASGQWPHVRGSTPAPPTVCQGDP